MTTPITSASILRAKVLSKSVLHGISDAHKTLASNKEIQKQEAARETERLQNVARARVRRNEGLVKGDEERIFGSNGAIKNATAWIRNLQHARYGHHASAQVTDRRLQLRKERVMHLRSSATEGERPPTVATRDSVQTALEKEQRTLVAARESMVGLEHQGKAVIGELEAVRGYLSQDAAKRRFAIEQDRSYIISFGSVTAGGSLPSPPEIDEEEVIKAQQTQQHVYGLEDKVLQFMTACANEIRKYDNEYKLIHAELEEELSRSTRTLDDLSKQLKGQAKEVDATTRMAERSLGEIKKKNLTKGDDVGASKVASLESLVQDLRLTREALQTDIRCKSFLLDIDERCRKVTTVGEKLFAERPKLQTNRSAPTLRTTGQFAVYR